MAQSLQRTKVQRLRRFSLPPLYLLLPSLVIALLMVVPVAYLVVRATSGGSNVWPLIFRERTLTLLWNTVRLASMVSITACCLAVPLAWLTVRTDLPLRRFWSVVLPLPLVIPSYAGAIAIIGALGPRGLLQSQFERVGIDQIPSIYGFSGAWATLSLFTFPYIYLSVRSALSQLDPTLEDASRSLGRGPLRTFMQTTLPQLRPSIGAGVLLVSLYTVSDFGVVTLMRYESFVRGIYTQYRAAFDRSLAAALGLILVMLAVTLVMGESSIRRRAGFYRTGSGSARQRRLVRLGSWRWIAFGWCVVVSSLSIGLPVAMFGYWIASGTSAGNDLEALPAAIGNSLTVSALAAISATLAAIPVALLAVRHRSSVSTIIERSTYLGFGLPGIVIALAFVFVGARFATSLYQTLPYLILAMVVRFLPHGVGSVRASLLQISPRLEEASRALGRSSFATLTAVTVPLARPGLIAGATLVFLGTMKELPIVLLLAPTGFDTLATEIWSATESGGFGRAAAPALIVILLSAVPTLLLDRRQSDAAERVSGS